MEFTLIILAFTLTFCDGARILVLTPGGSKSHKISIMPVAEALAEHGHQVTFISGYKSSKTVENLHEIALDNKEFNINFFNSHENENPFNAINAFFKFRDILKSVYDNLMKNVEFKKILHNRQADLVILDAVFHEFCLPIIEELRVPFIYYCTAAGAPWTYSNMGASLEFASIPVGVQGFTNQMSFFQRVQNVITGIMALTMRKLVMISAFEEHTKKDFPNSRSISILEKEANLSFVNMHPTTAWPRPLPPNVIPLGALHVRPASTLPVKLQQFVDRCDEHGFVIFSLGSLVKAAEMPVKLQQIFVEIFNRIPQCIVWKWEGQSIPGLKANTLLVDWIPQQDLLGHPNARLFITHGGLLSLQEAIYHAVPIIAFPFAADQQGNAAKAVAEGLGLKLNWETLDIESLHTAVRLVINDNSYKTNARRLSYLLRDELIPGKKAVVYWVEHVLRHGGTNHLKMSSIDMPFYQLYLLDVVGFLLFISMSSVLIIVCGIRWIRKRCGVARKMKKN